MSVVQLLNRLKASGVSIRVESGQLMISGAQVDAGLWQDVNEYRKEIISFYERFGNKQSYRPIRSLERRLYYRMSSAQRRLYVLHQLEPGSVAYNMPGVYELEGEVDRDRLETAIRQLMMRHEILRTVMSERDGEAVQEVKEEMDFEVELYEVKEEGEEEAVIGQFVRPFDLGKGPLLRAGLVEGLKGRVLLLIDLHHIIADGTSMGLLVKEFVELYEGGQQQEGRPELQYRDYAEWQQQELERERAGKQGGYWRDQFRGSVPVLELPTDHRRPAVKGYAGEVVEEWMGAEWTGRLKDFCEEHGMTEYMVMLSLYTAWLSRMSNQEDIVVGSPTAGRGHAELQGMIGMFVNTLAMRNYPRGERRFEEYAEEVKDRTVSALDNQGYQYEVLVEELGLVRDTSRNPLFDVMLVWQNMESGELRVPGLAVKPVGYRRGISKFDLTLQGREEGGEVVLSMEYDRSLFDRETIVGYMRYFRELSDHALGEPGTELGRLRLVGEAEERAMLGELRGRGSAEGEEEGGVVSLFEEQVSRHGGRIAVVYGEEQVSYGELNRRSNVLAGKLRERGVGRESLVGVVVDRSVELVIGILGILKAGGAYVPMDPQYPRERIGYMLSDSGAKWVLSGREYVEMAGPGCEVIDLSEAEWYTGEGPNLRGAGSGSDLAYVIYTSGSTGRPKGVMIEHGCVVSLVKSISYVNLSEENVILSTGSPSFDATTFEYWGSLLNGGKLVLCSQATLLDAQALKKRIVAERVTTMWFTAGWFNGLVTTDIDLFSTLGTILIGGEKLSVPHVYRLRELYPYLEIINGYGPTENTTFSLCYRIRKVEVDKELPIGSPLENRKAYIVDRNNHLHPVGVPGEIYVGGAGLARGYMNRPELTAEKFVADPFSGERGSRLYRSGDLARWLPEGEIEFLGRMDQQVKVRGYRIEPGEIEQAMLKEAGVRSAAVVVRQDGSGDGQLCAYYVSGGEVDEESLRRRLERELPAYMLPGWYMELAELPLTVNGKVDRKGLPAPQRRAGSGYMGARTETERRLVTMWSRVLGIEESVIGVRSNFFELGGHSLKATILGSQIHQGFGRALPLAELFRNPTIESVGRYLEEGPSGDYRPIRALGKRLYYRMSSAQRRLYVLHQLEPGSVAYNMPGVYELEGEVDRDRLETAIRQLMMRHEILRTVMSERDGEAVQEVKEEMDFEVELYEVKEEGEEEAVIGQFVRPFDLGKGPLLRAGLVEGLKGRVLLLIDLHHIIADGTSMGLLVKEFVELYEGGQQQEGRPELQYRDYAEWQQQELERERAGKQGGYWRDQFRGSVPVLELPTDHRRPAVKGYAGEVVEEWMGAEWTGRLKDFCEEHGMTEYMVMLSLYTAWLSRMSNQEDIVVGSPTAGRGHAELQGMIGMFVNTLAMRNYPRGERRFEEYAEEVKDRTVSALDNQGYQYEVLVEELGLVRDTSRNPLFDVMLVWQNMESGELRVPGLAVKPVGYRRGISKFDLTLQGREEGGEVVLSMEYDRSLFDRETIVGYMRYFRELSGHALGEPGTELGRLRLVGEAEERAMLGELRGRGSAEGEEEGSVVSLFEEQVSRHGGRIAVVYGEEQVSYGELNRRSNVLAGKLRERGVGRESLVGVVVDRSVELVIGILGILKAGGAYVPMDPQYPRERIGYMLSDSGAKWVLSAREYVEMAGPGCEVIDLSEAEWYAGEGLDLRGAGSGSDLAYVIYTSGSTGRPKGVMIEQKGIVNLVACHSTLYRHDQPMRASQVASMGFDAMGFEVWPCLLTGGSLFIADGKTVFDPEAMKEWLRRMQITISYQPTVMAELLLKDVWPSGMALKYLNAAGEKLNYFPREEPGFAFYNLYGPTEGTIWVSVAGAEALADHGTACIGRPIRNAQVYILREGMLQPAGVPGELCVGGLGVGRGYMNLPELTAEKFVADPFSGGEGSKLYRSGDLARWLPEGEIEFLGRMDQQVKVRGYRIEPGEIEQAMLKEAGVRSAAVVVRQDGSGDGQLCAYYVSGGEVDEESLRRRLERELPAYMLPGWYMELAELPLTVNGKVDRKGLPAPQRRAGSGYVGARTETERRLVTMWSRVLGIEESVIGVKSNFFELGGNSLKIVGLKKDLDHAFKREIPVTMLFKYFTVAAFAAYLDEEGEASVAENLPARRKEEMDHAKKTMKKMALRTKNQLP